MNNFDTEIAKDVGVNAAILYQNIHYWCDHNRANETNEYDGLYWTYNSMRAFADLFPYLSEAQVRQALKVLEAKGYIKSGYHNKAAYDRTKWYADLRLQSEKNEDSICHPSQMEMTQVTNGNDMGNEPIPNINTNIKPNNTDIYRENKPQKTIFVPPTLEEIEAYCKERNNKVDSQQFFDYYSTGEWKDAKGNPVKNWKQKIITWEKENKEVRPRQKGYKSSAWVTGEEAGFVFNDNKTVDPEPGNDQDIPEDILNMFGE